MKAKIVICIFVLMFSAFAGRVFGGTEGPDSTAYGYGTGSTSYSFNTFIGNYAGAANTATNNTFVGYQAGSTNTSGTNNTFIGNNAGVVNTSSSNTFIGSLAGLTNSSGSQNVFIGQAVGSVNSTGSNNTIVGQGAGIYNSGDRNTFIGSMAGMLNTGAHNTFLGEGAGANNNSGNYNVFLGDNAGSFETGSNKLYIANSWTTTPLIYGDFSGNGIVGINGYLGIGTQAPVRMVHLSGPNAVFRMDRSGNTAGSTSSFQMVRTDTGGNVWKAYVVGVNATGINTGEFVIWDNGTHLSGAYDRRMTIANDGSVTFPGTVTAQAYYSSSSLTLKDNVRTYENALDTVNRLRGVSFDWKDSGKPSVGLIAEEVAKVVPEVVAYNDGAATGVNYASLVGVLVEAVKEQQGIVKEQQAQHQAEMKEQQQINAELRAELNELKGLLTSK